MFRLAGQKQIASALEIRMRDCGYGNPQYASEHVDIYKSTQNKRGVWSSVRGGLPDIEKSFLMHTTCPAYLSLFGLSSLTMHKANVGVCLDIVFLLMI